MNRDIICGMKVENEQFTYEFEGKKYYFCSQGCLDRFKNSPNKIVQKHIYDLIIIGGGPAGLSAAVFAAKLKIDTFLISREIGENAFNNSKINTYKNFEFPNGKELIKKFQTMFLHEHYLEHKIDDVISIEKKDKNFEILTMNGNKFYAPAIIIASGKNGKRLNNVWKEKLLEKGKLERSISQTSYKDVFKQSEFSTNPDFYQDIIKLNEKGEIITNSYFSTNVNGIFACGEVTNRFDKGLINASEDGVKAAYSVKKYLVKEKKVIVT